MRPILRKRGPHLRRSCCYRARFAFFASIRMLTPESAARIARQWDDDIVPQLVEYIRIPAKSPHFDPAWEANGHIETVIRLAEAWARAQPVRGMKVEIVRLPGRTPVLFFECRDERGERRAHGAAVRPPRQAAGDDRAGATASGRGSRVIEDGKLYGRGGADDGYAVFAALAAIGALQAQGVPHARCVGLIETCEESGSYDLPAYLEAARAAHGRASISSSGSTPAAATTSSCGRRRRCAVSSAERSPSTC